MRIRALCQQQTHQRKMAVATGKHQWRRCIGGGGIHSRPMFKQQARHRRVAIESRIGQRRPVLALLGGADRRTGGQQFFNAAQMACQRGQHQSRVTIFVSFVQAGAILQQEFQHRLIAIARGQHQQRIAGAIRGIHVHATLQQLHDRGLVVVRHGLQQIIVNACPDGRCRCRQAQSQQNGEQGLTQPAKTR